MSSNCDRTIVGVFHNHYHLEKVHDGPGSKVIVHHHDRSSESTAATHQEEIGRSSGSSASTVPSHRIRKKPTKLGHIKTGSRGYDGFFRWCNPTVETESYHTLDEYVSTDVNSDLETDGKKGTDTFLPIAEDKSIRKNRSNRATLKYVQATAGSNRKKNDHGMKRPEEYGKSEPLPNFMEDHLFSRPEKMKRDVKERSKNKDKAKASTPSFPLVGHPVRLHVYDLHNTLVGFNKFVRYIANTGVYHVGIEVHGVEYMFCGGGASRSQKWYPPGSVLENLTERREIPTFLAMDQTLSAIEQCGIVCHLPKAHTVHVYKETHILGYVSMSHLKIQELIIKMADRWPRQNYHFTLNNCLHFASDFAKELKVGNLPEYIMNLIDVSRKLTSFFNPEEKQLEDGDSGTSSGPDSILDKRTPSSIKEKKVVSKICPEPHKRSVAEIVR